MKKLISSLIFVLVVIIGGGCVYYNTFYNARKAFKDGESKRAATGPSGYKAASGSYKRAIEKTDIIFEKYPRSKWYDDALYVSGVSHYWIDEYSQAEKRFRELLANFPETKYYKEAQLYLARAKLKMGQEDEAGRLFEELLDESADRIIRANAALSLGEYYFAEKDYAKSAGYFQSIIDSLGDDNQRKQSRMFLADSYYNRFLYRPAIKEYESLLNEKLSFWEEYKIRFRIGECLLLSSRFEEGLEVFFKLRDNSLYYDSLAPIKLMIAQGYEWDSDMDMAEAMYKEIAIESPRKKEGGMANYIMGLIYQYDYEDYKRAKEYYDAVSASGRASDVAEDAIRRSANIGKLEGYQKLRFNLDSTSSQDEVDNAARTQYLYAELYLAEMNKPDSAQKEFRHLLESFPDAYLAPKALIATAVLYRDYYNDTVSCDSILRGVIRDYSRSDFVSEAIGLLGLSGTSADTGYAALYYHKSEYFLFDDYNLDSARYYMARVASEFPYSRFNEQARFALLWMTEEFASPGDSSLYYAYYYFSDSFPESELGQLAGKKLIVKPKIEMADDKKSDSSTAADDSTATGDAAATDSATAILTVQELCQRGPDGKVIWEVQELPNRYDRQFNYPMAAYAIEFPDYLEYFIQIKIDPFGDISDIKLINPTQSAELNEEVTETVLSGHFNTSWILPEFTDSWWCFKYRVNVPRR